MPDQPNADRLLDELNIAQQRGDGWREKYDASTTVINELTSRVAVLEAENERLREQIKQLQVYGNMQRRRRWPDA